MALSRLSSSVYHSDDCTLNRDLDDNSTQQPLSSQNIMTGTWRRTASSKSSTQLISSNNNNNQNKQSLQLAKNLVPRPRSGLDSHHQPQQQQQQQHQYRNTQCNNANSNSLSNLPTINITDNDGQPSTTVLTKSGSIGRLVVNNSNTNSIAQKRYHIPLIDTSSILD